MQFEVDNMSCGHCARTITKALQRLDPAAKVDVDVKWVGFDIPNEFVVGYGLDFADAYRGLRCVGTLAPHVYS